MTSESVPVLSAEEEAAFAEFAARWRTEPTVTVDSGYAGLAIQRLLATLDAERALRSTSRDSEVAALDKVLGIWFAARSVDDDPEFRQAMVELRASHEGGAT